MTKPDLTTIPKYLGLPNQKDQIELNKVFKRLTPLNKVRFSRLWNSNALFRYHYSPFSKDSYVFISNGNEYIINAI
ncbi:unnamed protein product [marine sediment metagenome]|uniref:Uncharacterized protein n=1 Tax=marine sediment metagenome TaxID=412755 RepID=X1U8S7_9ZZZZ